MPPSADPQATIGNSYGDVKSIYLTNSGNRERLRVGVLACPVAVPRAFFLPELPHWLNHEIKFTQGDT